MSYDNFILAQEALDYHAKNKPGKISIKPTKPMFTQEDLSLAYSPGVAQPVKAIAQNIDAIYDYTSRGNMIAVISNGTAILGLGNLGAAASKPVMEGKAVLFKKFADIDSFDLEIDTQDPDEFINCVKNLKYSFGGINLEDIKSPECFYIENKLKELLDIPVFHDDQHGTAIITVAGIMNAAEIVNKNLSSLKIVVNGAGAAAIACLDLLTSIGIKKENVILCDTHGVVYKGRQAGMNQWKAAYAIKTELRTLDQAMIGADVFLGLSAKGALMPSMVQAMAPNPIIFALANPDPEIMPEEVIKVRSDAIIATGRSDYPNQINNLMCFPYIFRGALDVRAKTINFEMKIAAAKALAGLAKQLVPIEVSRANANREMEFGKQYIIPSPFDPRLITTIPVAVAAAAIQSGVARTTDFNLVKYKTDLLSRINPVANYMNLVYGQVAQNAKIIFAEGEDLETIKAALQVKEHLGASPVLVGRENKIHQLLEQIGQDALKQISDLEIINAANTSSLDKYVDIAYGKLQRKGYLYRDCARLVKTDKNVFAACLLDAGYAHSLITGNTRNYESSLQDICKIIDINHDEVSFAYYILVKQDKQIMIVDANFESLSAKSLAYIATQSAKIISNLGMIPKVAFISYANFSQCKYREKTKHVMDLLEEAKSEFEFDGNLTPDVAMDKSLINDLYPFCKLTDAANILIMPNFESTVIALKLLQKSSSSSYIIGPILTGMTKSVQVISMGSSASEILNLAAISLVKDFR